MAIEPAHLRPVADAPAEAQAAGVPGVHPPTRRGGQRRFLTDVLIEREFVSRERVEQAVQAARVAGRTPEQLLLEQGALNPEQMARATAERLGLDYLDLNVYAPDMSAANLVAPAIARRYGLVPVAHVDERTLLVAMADPANVVALDDIAIRTGMQVKPAVAAPEDISALISRLTRMDHAVAEAVEADDEVTELTDLREAAVETPVIKLVNSLLTQAVDQGASDIHFEPGALEMRVRFRVDGVLTEATQIPRRMIPGVVSRIKIMADLDISERRLPQDGRIGLKVDNADIDVRVVTLPSVHGESVVMRILDRSNAVIELAKLGLQAHERERIEHAIQRSFGAVLVTGPTGSGKSTTLYGALNTLNSPEKNIVTIEDPVEYQLEGITQIQVNPKAGLTFANGLRSMMRADPDIIMVGEIRDRDTAQIAVESALTGHLVLSTLHTNDAPTAITRLTEMGVEPFLVASALEAVVAQRLARVLCPNCKKRVLLDADTLSDAAFPAMYDIEGYEPVGCARCGHTGYRGRIGLFEVMRITDDIRDLTLKRASADQIGDAAIADGMRTLREDGFEKVKLGLTSIDEVVRVSGL